MALTPATDDETVVLSAKQSMNGSPTVTVKSQTAMVLTATAPIDDYGYNLTLPITYRRALARHLRPLLITPSSAAQAGVEGKYMVQAPQLALRRNRSTKTSLWQTRRRTLLWSHRKIHLRYLLAHASGTISTNHF